MNSPVELSVIIVNYNGASVLKPCLESVLGDASYKGTLEVIVVDNASTDGSGDLSVQFPQVKWIFNAVNTGFSRANNQGVVAASGEFVFLLNNDTVVHPGAFTHLITALKMQIRNKVPGMVGPKLIFPDGKMQSQVGLISRFRYGINRTQPVSFMIGAALMLRRDLYLDVGGLDPHYLFYNEDLDLCKTLIQKGYTLLWVPQAVVTHYQGVSTKTIRPFAMIEGVRGGLYFAWKHYPIWAYALYCVGVGIWLATTCVLYTLFGLFSAHFRQLNTIYAQLFWILLRQERISPKDYLG